MTDDTFFERLRGDARHLQFTPDDVTVARLSARIRARLAGAQPTVAQLLAGWLRPLAAALSVMTESRNHDNPTVDQIAANNTEISVDGVAFGAE